MKCMWHLIDKNFKPQPTFSLWINFSIQSWILVFLLCDRTSPENLKRLLRLQGHRLLQRTVRLPVAHVAVPGRSSGSAFTGGPASGAGADGQRGEGQPALPDLWLDCRGAGRVAAGPDGEGVVSAGDHGRKGPSDKKLICFSSSDWEFPLKCLSFQTVREYKPDDCVTLITAKLLDPFDWLIVVDGIKNWSLKIQEFKKEERFW